MKKMYIIRSPERHFAGNDRAAAEPDHEDADDPHDHRAAGRRRGHPRHRLRDVPKQTMGALREDNLLALLRRVGLDDPDAAERFGQSPRDLGVDLAAFTEQRPQSLEGVGHPAAEGGKHDERDHRQLPVQPEQDAETKDRGQESPCKLHEPCADKVPDPFRIAHDARDQHAGLRRIEVANGQMNDMRLNALAHVGDGALRGDAEDLRECEGGDRLYNRRGASGERNRQQELGSVLAEDLVDQPFGACRQHQSGETTDQHQDQPERQSAAMHPQQLARFAPRLGCSDLFLLCRLRGHRPDQAAPGPFSGRLAES
jgi:hypothetical protein